ncbi:adenosine 5'-monophosphoramidase HINT3-like [Lampris incognitus]|uniref:adenosine 5'-monophosphoramidase HINT3-like n=1 Tax=Lampris incognitus TaxID=2546036 RepID=UPI0024B5E98D|nr:adenosine 5'-monophosphoramidase HINT3-like [Lampris incognitus]
METQEIPQTRENEGCHFCVVANKTTETEILLSDDELVCFRDSKPGARHHYLVVPRWHLVNCKALHRDHIPLVEQMQEMGRSILEKNRVHDLEDIRMGFHLPPFSSVPHLHLHVLAPASQMSSRSLSRYGPQSYWFITVDKVLHQLRTHSKVK